MMLIANATPLIYLHRIGQLELLYQLFTQVTIPEAVARELQMGQHGEATIPELPWIRVMSVQHRSTVDVLSQDLDQGEAEALALALEHAADQVIMDDALARTAATLLHISCIGTLGILITCTLIGSRALAAYGDVDGSSAANNRPESRRCTAWLLRRTGASASVHGCGGTRSVRREGAGSVG